MAENNPAQVAAVSAAESNTPAQGASPAPAAPPVESTTPVLGTPLYVGLAIVGLFFGTFLGWAIFAPLDSAAVATGEVSVDTKRKTIQHLEGGIVGRIHVRDGDQVQAGQVLVHLDETQPLANLELVRKRYAATVAHEARLRAERDGADEVRFPEELNALIEEDRNANDVAAMIESERRIFHARVASISGQRAILTQRIAQLEAEIKGLSGEISSQDERVLLSEEEIRANRGLVKKGMVGKQRMLELQREAAEIRGERSQNLASIARVNQHIAETRLEINDLDTTRMSEVVQELRDAQSELYDLREKVRAAEDVLRRTRIEAPIAGTVVGSTVHTVGGVIAPGEPIMDVVPTGERLIIEARINPTDIDVVVPDMEANVRFTAFSQRSTRPVAAKVITVSADSLDDERTGERFYTARIELTGDLDDALGGKHLYPGMQAEVMILTGAQTPLEYFFKPITRSLNRAFREQ